MLHLLIDRLPLQLHCIFSKLSEIIIVGAERSSLQPPPSRQCTDHIVTGWLPCFKDDNQYHCAHTIVIPDRDFYIPHSDIWWPVCNTINALFQAWQSISLCPTCSDPPCLHTIVISDRDLHIQWLKKCPHVSQILKDSVIARHILSIRPNTWWLT